MARGKAKASNLMFLGGSRDGAWFEVPDHVDTLQLVPQQWVSEFVYPVAPRENEQASPSFTIEDYTRRGISLDDGDLDFFALRELTDYAALTKLMDRYEPEPIVYGDPPDHALQFNDDEPPGGDE